MRHGRPPGYPNKEIGVLQGTRPAISHHAERVSQFVGVHWHCRSMKWQATINDPFLKKPVYISSHDPTPEGELEAALAYNQRALELYGPTARIN